MNQRTAQLLRRHAAKYNLNPRTVKRAWSRTARGDRASFRRQLLRLNPRNPIPAT